VKVKIEKDGIDNTEKTVAVFKEGTTTNITYTATADGENNVTTSTKIDFTFGAALTGLEATDITITGDTGAVTKGELTGSGQNWSLAITVTTAGNVKVKIEKDGIENIEKTVPVYKAAPPTSWTKVPGIPAQMPGEIQTVCYGNGVFVAGSRDNDGRIAYSPDGINWTGLDATATTFGTNFVHVRFLNGSFWAVGGGGHMAHSENGTTWTAVENPGITVNIVDIAWGEVEGHDDGVFVAAGDSATMSYSTDGGVTWTANNQNTYFNNANFKAIEWGAGKFLAVGQLCRAIYSEDGINWTNISSTIASTVFDQASVPNYGSGWFGMSVATYGGGLYIVASQGVLGLSQDCVTWEKIAMSEFGFPRGSSYGWINCLIYVDGIFVLGGGDGESAYSTDGRNWTPITTTKPIFHNFHFINGLAYGNGKFVAVGATCSDPDCANDPDSTSSSDHAGNAGCIAYTP
jgi:hypothetical protein